MIGKFWYKPVAFVSDNRREVNAKLSSHALRSWFGDDLEVVYLVPESLALKVNSSDVESLIKDESRLKREFRSRIRELVSEPVAEENIIVIPSIGEYAERGYRIFFDNSVENSFAYLSMELARLTDDGENFEEPVVIYADVTTGHNIYTNTLVEALRTLIASRKLRWIAQGKLIPSKGEPIKAHLVSIPPITEDTARCKIDIQEYDVKAFFDFPVKNDFNLGQLIKSPPQGYDKRQFLERLARMYSRELKEISELLREARIAFNAIAYNTPLAFLNREIIRIHELNPRDAINHVWKIMAGVREMRVIKRDGDALSVAYPKINGRLIVNLLLAFNMLWSLQKLRIDLERVMEWGSWANLRRIECFFSEVYRKVGRELNGRFLRREVEDIETKAFEKLKNNEQKLLKEIFEVRGSADLPRNFFAHSGFLKDYTLALRRDGEIYLKYKSEYLKTIRGWLERPERWGKRAKLA